MEFLMKNIKPMILLLCFGVSNTYSQSLESVASSLSVRAILSSVEDVANGIIENAAEQYNIQMLNTGGEIKSTIEQFRQSYSGALEDTVGSIIEVERIALTDLYIQAVQIEDRLQESAESIINDVDRMANTAYRLIGNTAISEITVLRHPVSTDVYQVKAKGNAVMKANDVEITAGHESVLLEATNQDDRLVMVNVDSNIIVPTPVSGGYGVIPIAIKVSYCDGWWVFCRKKVDQYKTEIRVLPKLIGTVYAKYTTEKRTIEEMSKCTNSGNIRVKEERTSSHDMSIVPDQGWAFYTGNPKGSNGKALWRTSGCSNNRSGSYSRVSETPTRITGRMTNGTDSGLGKTCRMDWQLCATQHIERTVVEDAKSEEMELSIDNPAIIKLTGEKISLSHVVVTSPLWPDGKLVTVDGSNRLFKLNHNPATSEVTLSVRE